MPGSSGGRSACWLTLRCHVQRWNCLAGARASRGPGASAGPWCSATSALAEQARIWRCRISALRVWFDPSLFQRSRGTGHADGPAEKPAVDPVAQFIAPEPTKPWLPSLAASSGAPGGLLPMATGQRYGGWAEWTRTFRSNRLQPAGPAAPTRPWCLRRFQAILATAAIEPALLASWPRGLASPGPVSLHCLVMSTAGPGFVAGSGVAVASGSALGSIRCAGGCAQRGQNRRRNGCRSAPFSRQMPRGTCHRHSDLPRCTPTAQPQLRCRPISKSRISRGH